LLKYLIIAFLAATPALAQQAPDATAMGNELMECVGGKVQLRTKIAQLEAEIAKLKADAAKPAEPKAP
jgi:uncharacterized small protein (DUF1192 family)